LNSERAETVRVGERLRAEVITSLIEEFKKMSGGQKRLDPEAFRAIYTDLLRKAVRGCCGLLEERDFADIYFHRQVIFLAHFCEAINSAVSPRFPYRLAIVQLEREAAMSVVAISKSVLLRYFKTMPAEKIFYFFAATEKDLLELRFEGANRFMSPADVLKVPGSEPPR